MPSTARMSPCCSGPGRPAQGQSQGPHPPVRGFNHQGSSLTQKVSDSAEEAPRGTEDAGQEGLASRRGWPGTGICHE